MDNSYPLESYDSYHDQIQDSGGRPSAAYAPYPSRPFSIPRKAIPVGPHQHSDYTALIDPTSSSASDYTPIRPGTKPSRSSFFRWWLPEICASIISVAALLSIIVVLRHYDGRALSDLNLPNSLTLNGIIAAIATVNRAALMVPVGSAMSQEAWLWFSSTNQVAPGRGRFKDLSLSDDASRGAWGSLVFLLAARRRWLAYIGALVTILSLAFGAFAQQLLAIETFSVTSDNAHLQPGNIPRTDSWQYFSGNPAEFALSIPFNLRASIYNGMLSDGITPIAANCPTGNCTWPVTPSLAICGECSPSTYEIHCSNVSCKYTMPSRSTMTLINPLSTFLGPGFAVKSGRGGKYNASLHDKLYIANFDVVGAGYHSLTQGFNNATTKASECAMWMCIQAYKVSTHTNNQVQTLVQSFSYINSTEASGSVFANYTFPTLPAEMHATPGANYSVSLAGQGGFYQTLSAMFNGTANVDISNSAAFSDPVDAIWKHSANLDPWIKQVALSMTNALRNSSTGQSDDAIYAGTGYQLGVSVRWPWIALPAAVVLASLLFLAIVMVQTSRSPVEAWKGNPLAFLFFDVEQEMKRNVVGHTDRFNGIENSVSDARVMLKGKPGGIWTFKAA